jgi:poly(hydroxyalkanoate) depolymerase family esterase
MDSIERRRQMIRDLWQRTKALVARIFGGEPVPGRFETGSKFALSGFIGTAPFLWPSRDYLVYLPKGYSAWKRAPLLVLCHGCKQTPEELAQGTRVTAMADRMGCVVLLPRQKEAANPWRCWNWFEGRTMHGQGEAAIVAAQVRSVIRRYRIDRKRVLAAGMSAGGALAAVMGVRFPGLVTGVAVHSGLACGAAKSALSAIAVMQRGPDQDVARIGAQARAAAPASALPIPLLAVHGAADRVVAPNNTLALVQQYLRLNGLAEGAPAETVRSIPAAGALTQTLREWRVNGRLVARHVEVAGLGHAWSGGDATLPYNDAEGPDATALVGDFFADALS